MDRKTKEALRRQKVDRAMRRLKGEPAPKLHMRKSEKFKREKLTVKRIEKLLNHPGRYGDEHPGLYLQVRSHTNASWLYRWQRDGRERWMGLGSLRTYSRDEAVARAKEADRTVNGYTYTDPKTQLQVVVPPTDPLEAKRAGKSAAEKVTFKEVAEQYFAARKVKWKNSKYRDQASSIFKMYVYPFIGTTPPNDIGLKDIVKIMEQRVPEERGFPGGMFYQVRPETAERCRRHLDGTFRRSIVTGVRTNPVNPAKWKDNLEELTPRPKVIEKHHASLSHGEVSAFMAELRTREGIAPRALEFAILNANRTGEVIGAKWSEIDFETATWTIPAERMKADVEHIIPLSARAIALLKALPREDGNEFVFMGAKRGRGLSNMAMLVLLQKKMNRPNITVHGFRSSFKNWAMAVAHFPDELSEGALAHKFGSDVRRAYATDPMLIKRRKMMEAWAGYINKPPKAAGGNNVTPMRKRTA